ncbi:MAG: AbrB/MazE/SpoVT family DNA-binding domain-containing protein [Bryobacteraceae bacterium]|jgi:AbrB family looped-hinge helix DNA binding protein
MRSRQQQVEYLASSRIGEKGQLTIPQVYRDQLSLQPGDPVAVVRVGESLLLIPEQERFRTLCHSIAAVFERRQVSPAGLPDTLPEARARVSGRRGRRSKGQ